MVLKKYCYLIFLSFVFIFGSIHAQQQKLFGAHNNGTVNVFAAVNLPGISYNQVSLLGGSAVFEHGETTFDKIGYRYFVKAGANIFIINALAGNVLDTIKNMASLYNIEYDAKGQRLLGLTKQGSLVKFVSINLQNKAMQYSTISIADSIIKGESTYDVIGRRYFAMTDVGMISIDSTGALKDVLCANQIANGIEYDEVSNKIYYFEWNSYNYDFKSIEATTCSTGYTGRLGPNDSIAIKGESTFDQVNRIYYCRTNTGLVQVNLQTAQIQQNPLPNNFGQMEFADLALVGTKNYRSDSKIVLFPNPGNGIFTLYNVQREIKIEVLNSLGQIVSTHFLSQNDNVLNLSELPRGVYFYRANLDAQAFETGKMVLE